MVSSLAAPADPVPVPGHAVPPVPVQAQPGGAERLAQLRPVVLVQRLPGAVSTGSGSASSSP